MHSPREVVEQKRSVTGTSCSLMIPLVSSILRSFFSLPNCLLIFFKVALNFFFCLSTMSWTQDIISWWTACKIQNALSLWDVRWYYKASKNLRTYCGKKNCFSKMLGLMRTDSGFSLFYLTSHLLRTSLLFSSTTSFSQSDEIFFSCSAAFKNLSRILLSRALKASCKKSIIMKNKQNNVAYLSNKIISVAYKNHAYNMHTLHV